MMALVRICKKEGWKLKEQESIASGNVYRNQRV
jgi:hypothetical protein